jgi:hypothetical protein
LLILFGHFETVHPMWGWLRLRQVSDGDALAQLEDVMGQASATAMRLKGDADFDVGGPYVPGYTDMGRAHAAFKQFPFPAGYKTRDVTGGEMMDMLLKPGREAYSKPAGRKDRKGGGRGFRQTRGRGGKGFG